MLASHVNYSNMFLLHTVNQRFMSIQTIETKRRKHAKASSSSKYRQSISMFCGVGPLKYK